MGEAEKATKAQKKAIRVSRTDLYHGPRIHVDDRIFRLSLGNPGDVRPAGGGVSELRIDYGPGYRLYFVRRGKAIVVLLCGGDKRTQSHDIARAQELAREI